MNVLVYSVMHLAGILMLFMGYGGLLANSMSGAGSPQVRKLGSITSGIGLVLILVAGFGTIARLQYSYATPWIILKLLIWLILGAMIVLINRVPKLAVPLWWVILTLGVVSSWLVYFKPFSG